MVEVALLAVGEGLRARRSVVDAVDGFDLRELGIISPSIDIMKPVVPAKNNDMRIESHVFLVISFEWKTSNDD